MGDMDDGGGETDGIRALVVVAVVFLLSLLHDTAGMERKGSTDPRGPGAERRKETSEFVEGVRRARPVIPASLRGTPVPSFTHLPLNTPTIPHFVSSLTFFLPPPSASLLSLHPLALPSFSAASHLLPLVVLSPGASPHFGRPPSYTERSYRAVTMRKWNMLSRNCHSSLPSARRAAEISVHRRHRFLDFFNALHLDLRDEVRVALRGPCSESIFNRNLQHHNCAIAPRRDIERHA